MLNKKQSVVYFFLPMLIFILHLGIYVTLSHADSHSKPLEDGPANMAMQNEDPPIKGRITAVTMADEESRRYGNLGSIFVEAGSGDKPRFDKASVGIKLETKLLKRIGKDFKPANFNDLKIGEQVEVDDVSGPVAYSYPVQVVADRIVILEPAL